MREHRSARTSRNPYRSEQRGVKFLSEEIRSRDVRERIEGIEEF